MAGLDGAQAAGSAWVGLAVLALLNDAADVHERAGRVGLASSHRAHADEIGGLLALQPGRP